MRDLTPDHQIHCVQISVQVTKTRLAELDAKPHLTRAELYERDMALATIARGERILKNHGVNVDG